MCDDGSSCQTLHHGFAVITCFLQKVFVYAGVVAGRYTFNALLEGHSAAGNVRGAADVYDTMKDYGVKADHCTFIALFMVTSLGPFQVACIVTCSSHV